jgi:hypothetical protein
VKDHVHYEAAFEDYLRVRQMPYVAVDEAKKAIFRDAKLKSFDFIVYSSGPINWLADVKGRRWATRARSRRPAWENWVTQADLDGLTQWEEVFGVGFRGLLVFAYWLDATVPADARRPSPTDAPAIGTPPDVADSTPAPPPEIVHTFRDARYVFAGVPLEDYRRHARLRSPKWGTVNLPTREFAKYVRPMAEWL